MVLVNLGSLTYMGQGLSALFNLSQIWVYKKFRLDLCRTEPEIRWRQKTVHMPMWHVQMNWVVIGSDNGSWLLIMVAYLVPTHYHNQCRPHWTLWKTSQWQLNKIQDVFQNIRDRRPSGVFVPFSSYCSNFMWLLCEKGNNYNSICLLEFECAERRIVNAIPEISFLRW